MLEGTGGNSAAAAAAQAAAEAAARAAAEAAAKAAAEAAARAAAARAAAEAAARAAAAAKSAGEQAAAAAAQKAAQEAAQKAAQAASAAAAAAAKTNDPQAAKNAAAAQNDANAASAAATLASGHSQAALANATASQKRVARLDANNFELGALDLTNKALANGQSLSPADAAALKLAQATTAPSTNGGGFFGDLGAFMNHAVSSMATGLESPELRAQVQPITAADAQKQLTALQQQAQQAKTPQDLQTIAQQSQIVQGRLSLNTDADSSKVAGDAGQLADQMNKAAQAAQYLDSTATALKGTPQQAAATTAHLFANAQQLNDSVKTLESLNGSPIAAAAGKDVQTIQSKATPQALAAELTQDPNMADYPAGMAKDLVGLRGADAQLDTALDGVAQNALSQGLSMKQVQADPSLAQLAATSQNPDVQAQLQNAAKGWAKQALDDNLKGKDHGSYQKGLDAYKQQMKDLAQSTGLGEIIGKATTDTVQANQKEISDAANRNKPWYDSIGDFFGGVFNDFKNLGEDFKDLGKDALGVADSAFHAAKGALDTVGDVGHLGGDLLTGHFDKLGGDASHLGHDALDTVKSGYETVKGGLEIVGKAAGTVADGLGDGLKAAGKVAGEGLELGTRLEGGVIGGALNAVGLHGAANAVNSAAKWVGHQENEFTQGVGDGLSGVASGIGFVVSNPVKTAQAFGMLVAHPSKIGQVGEALWHNATKNGGAYAAGQLAAMIIPTILSGGAGGAADAAEGASLAAEGAEGAAATAEVAGGAAKAGSELAEVSEASDAAQGTSRIASFANKAKDLAVQTGRQTVDDIKEVPQNVAKSFQKLTTDLRELKGGDGLLKSVGQDGRSLAKLAKDSHSLRAFMEDASKLKTIKVAKDLKGTYGALKEAVETPMKPLSLVTKGRFKRLEQRVMSKLKSHDFKDIRASLESRLQNLPAEGADAARSTLQKQLQKLDYTEHLEGRLSALKQERAGLSAVKDSKKRSALESEIGMLEKRKTQAEGDVARFHNWYGPRAEAFTAAKRHANYLHRNLKGQAEANAGADGAARATASVGPDFMTRVAEMVSAGRVVNAVDNVSWRTSPVLSEHAVS